MTPRLRACCLLALAALATACNAPPAMPQAPAASASMPAPAPIASAAAPAPQAADKPAAPDRSCKADVDCAVKDVGNCCGRMPACVNANAAVDPAATRAWCASQGIASTCGFVEVTACQCVAGTCQAATGAVAQ
jgi:hypothetical protein